MSNNKIELDAAKVKLEELNKQHQQCESEYNTAVQHSSSYLGNDPNVDKHRDEMAFAALRRLNDVKAKIEAQKQLIESLSASTESGEAKTSL